MLEKLVTGVGIAVLALSFVAWGISGYAACETAPGGCGPLSLHWSLDNIRRFLPGFAVGGILLALGSLRWR